jgi:conjugative relaxase-like TrwC/TraI family protein
VRIGGANADRTTGNIVAALFEHETSRALDPHLHAHCIVFNETQDATENRWKALQNHRMLAAQKYVQNVYYHELALGLRAYEYTVENSARGVFPNVIGRLTSKRIAFWRSIPTRHAGTSKQFASISRTNNVHESSTTSLRGSFGRCGTVSSWRTNR